LERSGTDLRNFGSGDTTGLPISTHTGIVALIGDDRSLLRRHLRCAGTAPAFGFDCSRTEDVQRLVVWWVAFITARLFLTRQSIHGSRGPEFVRRLYHLFAKIRACFHKLTPRNCGLGEAKRLSPQLAKRQDDARALKAALARLEHGHCASVFDYDGTYATTYDLIPFLGIFRGADETALRRAIIGIADRSGGSAAELFGEAFPRGAGTALLWAINNGSIFIVTETLVLPSPS